MLGQSGGGSCDFLNFAAIFLSAFQQPWLLPFCLICGQIYDAAGYSKLGLLMRPRFSFLTSIFPYLRWRYLWIYKARSFDGENDVYFMTYSPSSKYRCSLWGSLRWISGIIKILAAPFDFGVLIYWSITSCVEAHESHWLPVLIVSRIVDYSLIVSDFVTTWRLNRIVKIHESQQWYSRSCAPEVRLLFYVQFLDNTEALRILGKTDGIRYQYTEFLLMSDYFIFRFSWPITHQTDLLMKNIDVSLRGK